MKATLHFKGGTDVTVEDLQGVNVWAERLIEFPTDKVAKLPWREGYSYVFIGANKHIATTGTAILYVEFSLG